MTLTPPLTDSWRSWPPEAKYRLRWKLQARPNQLTPPGDWFCWTILAGRGWGKTRVGAEDVAHYGLTHPDTRIAVVAPTIPDGRDTCVEGESGLLKCVPKECLTAWNRSLGELVLTNGTRYKIFPACEPERLRGPQHHRAWCDEMGSWPYPEAWDMLMMGLRLGTDPRVIATTTPRPVGLIRDRLADPKTIVTRGSTFENAKNLAAPFLQEILNKYQGTRLGRQELYAEVLEDVPGALWKRSEVDSLRVISAPEMKRIVVAVDPSVTNTTDSDECGIIVAGLGSDDHGYLMADLSRRDTPDGWARAAVNAYHTWHADKLIAEVNNGGDLVRTLVHTVDQTVAYSAVRASHGKYTRAEPIAALYEQRRVHHVGSFPELEDQMCSFVPGADKSPDRMDAAVWAFTELMLHQPFEFRRVITPVR